MSAEDMKNKPFWHYCEVCGKKELLTAEEAFEDGWDYPPDMGEFGVLSPRTCGDCAITDTLYWKVMQGQNGTCDLKDLTPRETETLQRIMGEPESLMT